MQDDAGDEQYKVRAPTYDRFREDKNVVNHKMIEHIDKIVKILLTTPKSEDEITYLVQRDNEIGGYIMTTLRGEVFLKSATKLEGSRGYA